MVNSLETQSIQPSLWDDPDINGEIVADENPVLAAALVTIPIVLYPSRINLLRAVRIIQTIRSKTHVRVTLEGIDFSHQTVALTVAVEAGTVADLKTGTGQAVHAADCLNYLLTDCSEFHAAFGQTAPLGSIARETLEALERNAQGRDSLDVLEEKADALLNAPVNGAR